jgi:hypothetical protein
VDPPRDFCDLIARGRGGGFEVGVVPFPGWERRLRFTDLEGVGGAVWVVWEGEGGAITTAGTARGCLREPDLGRPPRSPAPLTAFSGAPFVIALVEVGAGGFCETEGTLDDGDGVLLAVSDGLPPFWPELVGGWPPPRPPLTLPPRLPFPRPIPRKAEPGSAVLRLLQSLLRGEL